MRPAPSRADRERGFTLIEVLVALAIATLLLVPLLRIFSGGMREVTHSERMTAAALWAQSMLGSSGAGEVLATGSAGGALPDGYRWDRTVTLYHDSAISEGGRPLVPYDVTVTIAWRERNRDRSLSLETLRLAPPPQTGPP